VATTHDLNLPSECLGFEIYFSTPKSPASVPTKLCLQQGQSFLLAELLGKKLKFGLLSFFQVNIPLFNLALDDIARFLDKDKELVDFYSGVGAIGLPLSGFCQKVHLVDNNEEAIAYARDNIALNKISNAEATCLPAEKITELITGDRIIIVDPPRAGMHKKVVEELLLKKPPRIIYLSCNLSTQARDIELLQESYDLKLVKLYNFFPRTPHIEALIVLESR
jgi:tRNA/tmRNA/rRNA uracil-C5-methylase (TrmA/RlmC/RlmD family)